MTETKRPLKVFLCHAHADRDAVKALYTRLTGDGVDAWLDKEKLLPGQDWELEIRKAVREADVVVVCLSKQFNQSGFRQKEVRLALDTAMEKPEGEIFIIPARLEECDNLESLRKWHWVDLFEEDGYENLIESLNMRADNIGTILPARIKNQPKASGQHTSDRTIASRRKRKIKSAIYPSQERVLDVAVEKQVIVNNPTTLYVWIRRPEAQNIISVTGIIDDGVDIDEKNVKSKEFKIEFPVEDKEILPVEITLRLIAYDFAPQIDYKYISVPPNGDSQDCTFVIVPKRDGRLLLSLEVLKGQLSLVTQNLRTTAVESESKHDDDSMLLVTIPVALFVQPSSLNPLVKADIAKQLDSNRIKFPRQINISIIFTLIALMIFVGALSSPFVQQWFAPPPIMTTTIISPILTHTPVLPTKTSRPIIISTSTNVPLASEIIDANGVPMALVPAGEFNMGANVDNVLIECLKLQSDCDRSLFENSNPPHRVYIDTFYMDKYEVTNGYYQACVDEGVCDPPHDISSYTHTDYYNNAEFENYPVINVDWFQARTYCEWRGAKLPTEAQWEKAARGADGRTYPWGNNFDGNNVNFCDMNCPREWADNKYNDGYADTAPVGSYEGGKSPYGIYDMVGNVWEWVADWYSETYYQNSPVFNPLGPDSGLLRVRRGTSWHNPEYVLRASYRYADVPESFLDRTGFRCAINVTP